MSANFLTLSIKSQDSYFEEAKNVAFSQTAKSKLKIKSCIIKVVKSHSDLNAVAPFQTVIVFVLTIWQNIRQRKSAKVFFTDVLSISDQNFYAKRT